MTPTLADVSNYIDRLQRNAPYGVPETSHYGALEALLNTVGDDIEPGVFCVITPTTRDPGIPDGGLFSKDQAEIDVDARGFSIPPSRGVIEAKPLNNDPYEIAETRQVEDYLASHGQVLVTNFYQFLLVRRSDDGAPTLGEFFSLAEDDSVFLETPSSQLVRDRGEDFLSYLFIALASPAPITSPQELARFIAFYAREARHRVIRGQIDLDALASLREDLEAALGMEFEGEAGQEFFVSTLVQTLFYGVFSAWVLWSEGDESQVENAAFDWRLSQYILHIPVIQALIEDITRQSRLGPLGIMPVLDWTGETLNRVDRPAFFESFATGRAIQYFYEPFLEEFDPELRKQLGIWYTPPEIVEYMVERVDRVLRDEMGIEDGLADENVFVLDPACGTGTYLIAILDRVYRTKAASYGEDQAAHAVKTAIRNVVGQEPTGRVFGFEILPAPFVISHLQIGMYLHRLGSSLEDESERAGVYLTNSLAGWQSSSDLSIRMSQLEQESVDASTIKQSRRILVIIGNPPYNAFAGTSTEVERITDTEGLVDSYKEGLREEWGVKKFNLDDLYIRFLRIAERHVVEFKGEGVVCYISNFSYLTGESFVVMREQLLSEFDKLWVDNMNGDSRETGKTTPEGEPDPSVFSTNFNKAGIRVGTAISTWLRKSDVDDHNQTQVQYREFWGQTKRDDLRESIEEPDSEIFAYTEITPDASNKYILRPVDISGNYMNWPKVTELASEYPLNGPIERRGNSLICHQDETDELLEKLGDYLDSGISDSEMGRIEPRFMLSSGEFEAIPSRRLLHRRETKVINDSLVPYPYKPFDLRCAYLDTAIQPLFSRPSPELLSVRNIPANAFFITRDAADKRDEGIPFYFSNLVCDYDFLSGHARHFPVFIRAADTEDQPELFNREEVQATSRANLSDAAREYLANLGHSEPDDDPEVAELIWLHSLAIGFSSTYLEEHESALRIDWPRIPLPLDSEALEKSASLGSQIANLLDVGASVSGVTTGDIRDEYRLIGVQSGNDLSIDARWGYRDARGAIMPAGGDARERDYTPEELDAFHEGARRLSFDLDDVLALFGDTAFDIHLNDDTYWSSIPSNVYRFTIGGYQILKKWLSYRNRDVIGRPISHSEAVEVTRMARRLAALLLIQTELNTNYMGIVGNTHEWLWASN